MRHAAITVDVDRDVNLPRKGRLGAISSPKDGRDEPRFSSSLKGLELLVSALDKNGVKGTFFMEAVTAREMASMTDLKALLSGHEVACHAYEHEDLTGKDTGIVPSNDEIGSILDRSVDVLDDIFGKRRWGFRAPYLHQSDDILEILREKGFLYDSSVIQELENGSVRPYITGSGLPEVPIGSSRDKDGRKIVGYLWPYHEGKRPMADYIEMVKRFREGLLVLATHSWHMVETFCDGEMCEADVIRTGDDLTDLLRGSIEDGVEFVTVTEFLTERMGGGC